MVALPAAMSRGDKRHSVEQIIRSIFLSVPHIRVTLRTLDAPPSYIQIDHGSKYMLIVLSCTQNIKEAFIKGIY